MRPVLLPGCHVLRRSQSEIQLGLDPRHAVVLPDLPSVRKCLRLLAVCAEEQEYGDAAGTLALLAERGLVLDAAALQPASHQVAALARCSGGATREQWASRERVLIDAHAFGGELGERVARDLVRMLDEVGLRTRTRPSASGAARVTRATPRPAARPGTRSSERLVGVLIGVGEPRRELLDDWMRDGVPHLLVRLSEGSAAIGPFVVPGETACVRCLDAHHTDADQRWPLLVAQYADRAEVPRSDGVLEPMDGLLTALAVAWAARDVTSHAEGRRPSTWSTTIRLDPELTDLESRQWWRHPECGCGWA